MATRTETKAAIDRMRILVSDQEIALAKLFEKLKAEKSNTDTIELNREIRVQKAVLEGLKDCKKHLIEVFETLFENEKEKKNEGEGRGMKRKKEPNESNEVKKPKQELVVSTRVVHFNDSTVEMPGERDCRSPFMDSYETDNYTPAMKIQALFRGYLVRKGL